MINVQKVLDAVPHAETFCSVRKLNEVAERARGDRSFLVDVAGTSGRGIPIYHVRFGSGKTKALVVGGPHAHEPIGSVTVLSLLTLLASKNSELANADVEWHIVPCSDPDGASLNESWTQRSFTFENYVKGYYVQPLRQQVDACFPIAYKKLTFTQPSPIARTLQKLLDQIRPDFFFSLHNSWGEGGYFVLNHGIADAYYAELRAILTACRIPVQSDFRVNLCPKRFSDGVFQTPTIRDYYDYLERTVPDPEKVLVNAGANSWDYLSEIKPDARSFVAELGYFRFPHDSQSLVPRGKPLRQILLRQDADSKFLAAAIIEEWDRLEGQLESSSPFFPAVLEDLISRKEGLLEGGMPISRYVTRDVLLNPRYSGDASESDLLHAYLVDGGLYFLRTAYQFVRLLKDSRPSPDVRRAIDRFEALFKDALAQVAREVDLSRVEIIDCTTLAKAQLGSGLVVLNAVMADSTSR